jgi:RNA polymerase sigma factor (TIGR02999 family)
MSLTIAERFEQVLARVADQRDRATNEQLFAALYHELHRLAQHALSRDRSALSISATTLLHEAYLNFFDRSGVQFSGPRQFLAYAARAMRGLTIDAMRRRGALKRGAGIVITRLNTHQEEEPEDDQGAHINEVSDGLAADQDFAAISEALEALAAVDASLAELVDLKYFSGLSLIQIAALRGVSKRTVQREWEKARLFLFKSLTDRNAL